MLSPLKLLLFATVLVITSSIGISATTAKKVRSTPIGFRPSKVINSKLPRVLLVGDSICSGYSRIVIRSFKGKASVDVWSTGINLTRKDIEKLQKQAIAHGPYDVIHFNIGLHGLSNRIPKGKYDPLMKKYVQNWKKLAPNSKLIWASTTPLRINNNTKLTPIENDKIVKRNAIAAKIMKSNNIVVNDLYGLMVKNLKYGRKDGCHWSSGGYALMARQINNKLCKALNIENLERPKPVTIVPVNRNGRGGWSARNNKMNKRVSKGRVDLVFIGDSITHGWESRGKKVWKNFYARRNAVNLGIGGDRTQHVLWRLQNGNLKGISPKLAVVMIGTNNAGSDSPEDIATGVKAIVTCIEERCPTTKILILAIFPRGKNNQDKKRVVNQKANEIIKTFANNITISYMNINDKFLSKDGTLSRNIMSDLLHPNAKGYQIWAEAIEKKVAQLMEEPPPPERMTIWNKKVEYKSVEPAIEIFLAPKEKRNGAAVVVCPGGGYARLAIDHEGYQIARKFNENGVTAFVLSYRHKEDHYPAPLLDVQRAIRLVRHNAKRFKIDPKRIGVMGFSAGGHLASMADTLFTGPHKDATDKLEQESDRPDFAMLIYPVISLDSNFAHKGSAKNLLGSRVNELATKFSSQNNVTHNTPPTFLVHASDDHAVPVENSIVFYQALIKNRVPAEMHIYEKGGHGFGLRKKGITTQEWFNDCIYWLKCRKLLNK